MMMKKKILRYSLILAGCLGSLGIISCQDWLDVKPKTEMEAEDLFSTEDGFKGALAGVYTAMNQTSLYGREMTFGLVDALAQQWKIGTNHAYTDAVKYEYKSVNTRMTVDSLWVKGYRVIANANSILSYIDKVNIPFTGDNKEIIKGEALAIRAYIHFDLLRLFAPYGQSTSVEDGIPYVDEISKNVTVSASPKQVLAYIIRDLKAAAQCLASDPVLTGREVTTDDDNGYLINRNFHLNYYAVIGLLARVEMYAGNTTDARTYAMKVIDAHNNEGKFPWGKSDEVVNSKKELRDRTISSEHLFALNNRKLTKYIEGYFMSTNNPLLTRISVADLFGNVEDYRKNFFETMNYVGQVPSKLWQMDGVMVDGKLQTPKKDRMPMIRLSEMYYIVAECDKADPQTAIGWLNQVLTNRGYTDEELLQASEVNSPEAVQAEILKEYRREFICEGQLFFYHKRMGDRTLNEVEVKYVLPKPENELEFGK